MPLRRQALARALPICYCQLLQKPYRTREKEEIRNPALREVLQASQGDTAIMRRSLNRVYLTVKSVALALLRTWTPKAKPFTDT